MHIQRTHIFGILSIILALSQPTFGCLEPNEQDLLNKARQKFAEIPGFMSIYETLTEENQHNNNHGYLYEIETAMNITNQSNSD